jgi:catechol 2,3-dioxygenase-like lactoylglutathione lyase family enzyme
MRKVHHVGITVRDLDVSVAFYHDLLGLPFAVPPTPWFEGADLAGGLGVAAPVALRVALFDVGEGATWLEILQIKAPGLLR